MISENFNRYEEWLESNGLSKIFSKINKIEDGLLNFVEGLDENGEINEHAIKASWIRDIGESICEYIFQNDVKEKGDFPNYTFEKYKRSTFSEKIHFLKDEKVIHDNHIREMLKEIKNVSNTIAHDREDENDRSINYLGKSRIISVLNYIAIIISWLMDKSRDISFDSSSYYQRNQSKETVDVEIKEVVKLINDKGIEIKGASLLNILYDEIRYKIPLYQRGYDWGEKELKDLVFDIEKRSAGDFESYHFFGNVSLIASNDKKGKLIKVIDGQQRFTTSIILLRSIYNRWLELSDSEDQVDVNLFNFINSKLKIDRVDNEITMKTINKIWEGNDNYNELEKKTNAYEAASFFRDWLREKQVEDLEKYIESLSKFIIGINWIKSVDEFELFESLNAKGKKLSNFDIFKNYLYSLINPEIEKINEKEITTIFENLIEKKFDALSKTKRVSAKDTFMQFFIEYILDEKESKKSIFNKFKEALLVWMESKELKKDNLNLQEFTVLALEISKIIDASLLTLIKEVSIWQANTHLNKFVDNVFYIINSPAYAKVLFHYLVGSDCLVHNELTGIIEGINNSSELVEIIKTIEVWRVRREISYNFGASTMGSMIGPFLKEWKLIEEKFCENLRELILNQEDKLILPSIEKFENDLLTQSIASNFTAGIILYRINQTFKERVNANWDYKVYNVIEPIDSKRSKEWNNFIESVGINDRTKLESIGNYIIHGEDKEFKDFSKYNIDYLEQTTTEDNVSINIHHTFPSPSILKLKSGIDEALDDRAKYFTNRAIEIFDF